MKVEAEITASGGTLAPQVIVNGKVWSIIPDSVVVRIPDGAKVRAVRAVSTWDWDI